mmetsp:Transcript_6324/g.26531  ORF Transcript_6324/g.26531 Transcript_6324/m.26531 type:complete len:209 (-) Transcript_6324:188-814(-)
MSPCIRNGAAHDVCKVWCHILHRRSDAAPRCGEGDAAAPPGAPRRARGGEAPRDRGDLGALGGGPRRQGTLEPQAADALRLLRVSGRELRIQIQRPGRPRPRLADPRSARQGVDPVRVGRGPRVRSRRLRAVAPRVSRGGRPGRGGVVARVARSGITSADGRSVGAAARRQHSDSRVGHVVPQHAALQDGGILIEGGDGRAARGGRGV